MGLTENQKNMIRCLANKDIKNTREWAKIGTMSQRHKKLWQKRSCRWKR